MWQVRNAIGVNQKRKIMCVWSVSLTSATDRGELRVYDKGEAEALTDEQRKSFFGVWNSVTRVRTRKLLSRVCSLPPDPPPLL